MTPFGRLRRYLKWEFYGVNGHLAVQRRNQIEVDSQTVLLD